MLVLSHCTMGARGRASGCTHSAGMLLSAVYLQQYCHCTQLLRELLGCFQNSNLIDKMSKQQPQNDAHSKP